MRLGPPFSKVWHCTHFLATSLPALTSALASNGPIGSTLGASGAPAPTTYGIGNAFLTDYVLPFEIASIVLLAALIGAIVVSRKEVKG